MWTVFKAFIELVTILLLFYFLIFLALRVMWDFSFPIRDQTYTSTLEGEIVTTGQSGGPDMNFEEVGICRRSLLLLFTPPLLSSLPHSLFLAFGEWVDWAPLGGWGQLWAELGQGLSEVIYLDLALWTLTTEQILHSVHINAFQGISTWQPLWLGR